MWIIRQGQRLVQASGALSAPVQTNMAVEPEEYVDQQRMGLYVGLAAILLAPVMLLSSRFLDACFYDSISHYYYSRYTGDYFVGTLIFIAVFLFAYNGRYVAEKVMAKCAGVGALLIAFFPTSATGCEGTAEVNGRAFISFSTNADGSLLAPISITNDNGFIPAFQMFDNLVTIPLIDYTVHVETFHFGGAAVVFGVLTLFCFFVFTIPRPGELEVDRTLKPGKARRNGVYYGCGVVMAASIGVIILDKAAPDVFGGAWESSNLMFWMEFGVLLPFGVAWFFKGRMAFWGEDSGPARWFRRVFMD